MLVAQLALLAPSFNWRSLSTSSPPPLPPIPQLARRYIRATLALIAVVAFIGPLRRSAPATSAPAPAHARARIINAGIWTVHFGIDNVGRDSQRGMRDLFRDMDLDVVGLLETDLQVSQYCYFEARLTTLREQRPVFGSRDMWVKGSSPHTVSLSCLFQNTCASGRPRLRTYQCHILLTIAHQQYST